jgi:hypothetical protein
MANEKDLELVALIRQQLEYCCNDDTNYPQICAIVSDRGDQGKDAIIDEVYDVIAHGLDSIADAIAEVELRKSPGYNSW